MPQGRLSVGKLEIVRGSLPLKALRVVEGEQLVFLVEPVGVRMLDGGAGASVEILTTVFRQPVVGHLAGQRVLEHERPLSPAMPFLQELAPLELVQRRKKRSVTVPDSLDELERELAPEHGRDLNGTLVSGV